MAIENNDMVMPVTPFNGGGIGNGFGGDGWWILLLFILLGNGGMGGFGGGSNMFPWMNQNTQMSEGFAGVTSAINNSQMANMERSFAAQTAQTESMNALQAQFAQCCCDNRLATAQTQSVVQSEGAATRLAIQNQTQQILDKMCQQEIDALKAQNAALQTQVNMLNLAASQSAQTAALVADNTAQTQYIVNRVAPYPIPAYVVANPTTATTPATTSAG